MAVKRSRAHRNCSREQGWTVVADDGVPEDYQSLSLSPGVGDGGYTS